MVERQLRGIAVVDAGYTNTKVMLFSPEGEAVAERKAASRQIKGAPYDHLDHTVVAELCRTALPELDRILPVDAIVPAAHGAALALLGADGRLALPVMDYQAAPPAEIVNAYRAIEPPFAEVYCPLLPMALTHGLQLFWQEQAFPHEFAQVATVIPWIQYVAQRLSGVAVCEISSMSCQTQLMDVARNRLSSLVTGRGWDRLFPRFAKAWEVVGTLQPEFRGDGFRGAGRVLAGVHDSTGNCVRYLAAGLGRFTLVSSGTWLISFDTSMPFQALDPKFDTNTNTDIFGRQVACSRFFGGREFELVAGQAPAEAASLADVQALIDQGTLALPSFSNSGGPMPGTGGKGRITGPQPKTIGARASLAALYCALMCDRQLAAIRSQNRIVVDGPFAQNPVFLSVLAALRPKQKVEASALRDGTTAGAALIAQIDAREELPQVALALKPVTPARLKGLKRYAETWLALS
jgi:sugar (pentulose or hexulose) kinase